MSIEWNQLKVSFLSLRKYKWVWNMSVFVRESVFVFVGYNKSNLMFY